MVLEDPGKGMRGFETSEPEVIVISSGLLLRMGIKTSWKPLPPVSGELQIKSGGGWKDVVAARF